MLGIILVIEEETMSYVVVGRRKLKVNGVLYFWHVEVDKNYSPRNHHLHICSDLGDVRFSVKLEGNHSTTQPEIIRHEIVYEYILKYLAQNNEHACK